MAADHTTQTPGRPGAPSLRRALCAALALATGAGCAHTSGESPPADLREAVRLVGVAHKITWPQGIQTLERVELGGIPQWISIRGKDRRNPVLLFVHGGPGFPVMPASYTFQTPWEEYFTVVQWDQRGAGKTYAANDAEKVAPTLTPERMFADAEELVTYLRQRFDKRRIVLMGHSWGSIVGLELAKRHPDWFHVYVGASQAVDVPRNERESYETVLAEARRTGNAEAVKELEAIAPYPGPDGSTPIPKLYAQRKWVNLYGGYNHHKPQGDHYFDIVQLSPDYTPEDVEAFGPAIAYSFEALWPQFNRWSAQDVTELKCPVILMHGVFDLTTSPKFASEWLERVRAPVKKYVPFENSAHMFFMEEPGKVFQHLVQDVLPLAREGEPTGAPMP